MLLFFCILLSFLICFHLFSIDHFCSLLKTQIPFMNLYRWFSKTYRKTTIRSRKSWVFASGEKNGTVALPCSCKPRQIRHFDMFHFPSEVYIWKAAWLISVNVQFLLVGALSQLLKKMLICIPEQRQHFPPLNSACLRQELIMLQSVGCMCGVRAVPLWPSTYGVCPLRGRCVLSCPCLRAVPCLCI